MAISDRWRALPQTASGSISTAVSGWQCHLIHLRIFWRFPFIHSFIHSFINSFIHSFIHSFIFIHLFIYSFIHSFIHSYIDSPVCLVQSTLDPRPLTLDRQPPRSTTPRPTTPSIHNHKFIFQHI